MSLIQELRNKTGAGVTDCKNALVASNGDMAEATTWLRNKGKLTAAKLSNRVAAEGVVSFSVKGNKGVILEVNSETDFVSRGDYFRNLAQRIATSSLNSDKIPKEKLAALPVDEVNKLTIEVDADEPGNPATQASVAEAMTLIIGKVKENIKLRRIQGISVSKGAVGGYLHSSEGDKRGGRMGALVALESNTDKIDELSAIATQIATHVVGLKPEFISKEEVPKELIEGRISTAKTKVDARHVIEDIVMLEQKFLLNDSETVAEHLQKEAKRLGTDSIKVHSFVRFVVGEGIEKKEDDFAQQVMDQLGVKK
jgi:elongation factor Ts